MKYLFIIPILLGAIGYTYVNCNECSSKTSSLILANIEALAAYQEVGPNERECYKYWIKAPNDDSLAIWDWICDDCDSYWLTKANTKSTCKKHL